MLKPSLSPHLRRAMSHILLATGLLALLHGCGGNNNTADRPQTTSAAAEPRMRSLSSVVAADPMFTYDRPPAFSVSVTSDVRVPLRDGSYLACKLYRPAVNGYPAEGRFPGIVWDYTGYHVTAAATSDSSVSPFVQRGYNAIVCDARGSGDSPGTLDPFSPQEQQDNYDLIEWFAMQSWSDGNIGQTGISYGGHTATLVAANQPPHLKAIVPQNNLADWYSDTIYHGGIMSASISYWYAYLPVTASGGSNLIGPFTMPANTLATYAQQPFFNDYWAARGVSNRYDKFTIPTLQIHGWNDRYKGGGLANQAARPSNVWTIIGPWGHGSTSGGTAVGSMNGVAVRLAWFDRWLKGMADAPLPQSRITSLEMPEATSAGWKQFSQWPPAEARSLRLYFTPDKGLASQPAANAVQHSFAVNANDQGADPATDLKSPVANQHEIDASPYRVAYTTGAFSSDVVLAGSVNAVIQAGFSATDGNVIVRLSAVAPDGSTRQIATGWKKASRYMGTDHAETIEIGRTYPVPVELRPAHYRIPAGHALRLTVSSGDVPDAIPDAPPGVVGVAAGGQQGSYADIAVLEGFSAQMLGSGWLNDRNGKKVGFSASVQQAAAGFSGQIQLHDPQAKARVRINAIESITAVGAACGTIQTGAKAVEVRGHGSFNGNTASFRVCMQDVAEPGQGADKFYLACSSGCIYSSLANGMDDTIDGGNLLVQSQLPVSEGNNSGGIPSVVMLAPLPAQSAVAGVPQLFDVAVLDAAGKPVPGASVSLMSPGGAVGTLASDALGLTSFIISPLSGAEYWAVTGNAASNPVSIGQ